MEQRLKTRVTKRRNPASKRVPKFREIQNDELLKAAKPLLKMLNDGCHPHCKVIVTQTTVELVQGVTGTGTKEFLKD
jgi:hypothetical protein